MDVTVVYVSQKSFGIKKQIFKKGKKQLINENIISIIEIIKIIDERFLILGGIRMSILKYKVSLIRIIMNISTVLMEIGILQLISRIIDNMTIRNNNHNYEMNILLLLLFKYNRFYSWRVYNS